MQKKTIYGILLGLCLGGAINGTAAMLFLVLVILPALDNHDREIKFLNSEIAILMHKPAAQVEPKAVTSKRPWNPWGSW